MRLRLDEDALPRGAAAHELGETLPARDVDDVERAAGHIGKPGGPGDRLGLDDPRAAVGEGAQAVSPVAEHAREHPGGEVLVLAVDEHEAADRRDRDEGLQQLTVVDALDPDPHALFALVGREELEGREAERLRVVGDRRDLVVGHHREVEREVDVRPRLGAVELGLELRLRIPVEVAVHLHDRRDAAERGRAGLGRVVSEVGLWVELHVGIHEPREHVPAARVDHIRPVRDGRRVAGEDLADDAVASEKAAVDDLPVRVDEARVHQHQAAHGPQPTRRVSVGQGPAEQAMPRLAGSFERR